MNYYRRWLGSYKKKTAELSLVEHGVYTLLLDHYYATEKPLPAEVTRLSRICGAITHDEQRAVQYVADGFFPVASDGLRHNARADEELGIALATIEKQREGGAETAEKRWGKDRSTDDDDVKSTKARKCKSTKREQDKSTDESSNEVSYKGEVRSTDSLPIQPTTDNLQPTAVNHQPTGETLSQDTTKTPRKAARKPSAPHAIPASEPSDEPLEPANDSAPQVVFVNPGDADIPWWHSFTGIQRQATEVGVFPASDDEDWDVFTDRVIARSGPGPWDFEQAPERRRRIEQFRASGA